MRCFIESLPVILWQGEALHLMMNCVSRGLASWGKVQDIEPEPLLLTPPVYFQVIHNVKGGGVMLAESRISTKTLFCLLVEQLGLYIDP